MFYLSISNRVEIFKKLSLLLFLIGNFVFAQTNVSQLQNDKYQRVDAIEIIGNEDTEDFVILRELTFGIGDSVNSAILFFNRERIFSLRIFTKVNLSIVNSKGFNTLQILIEESWYIFPVPFINVREKTLKRTSYGISLKYKNFRGRNETIRLTTSLGYDPFYSFEYENPLIIPSQDINFAFAFAYGTPVNKSPTLEIINGEEFDFKVFSTNTILGKRFNKENNLYFALGYSSIETPSEEVIPLMASSTSVDKTISSGFIYVFDSRNLRQFAESGFYFELDYLHNGFGMNNISYNEFSFEARKYNKIYSDLMIKGRFHTKQMFGKYIPPYSLTRFGYDYYTRGNRYLVREGKNRLLGSVEITYPIITEWNFAIDLPIIPNSLTRARIAVHASIFADAGTVYNDANDLSFSNLNSGYGAGISFLFLPYSSFRVEYDSNEFGIGELLIETGISF